jgi:rhodanese-related sulfurtransferase
MDYLNFIILGFIILFFIQRFIPTKGVKQISTSDLKNELQDKNKQFIDVRTSGEFRARNIPSFKNIPLQQLAQKTNQLSKENEVVVICQSGMRSKQASKLLKKQGFNKVTNVKGGMNAWL